jgi:ABC transporter substrate binding protein
MIVIRAGHVAQLDVFLSQPGRPFSRAAAGSSRFLPAAFIKQVEDRCRRRGSLLYNNRIRISTVALAARLPTMHSFREYVEAGSLMSYGANIPDLFRRLADYADKILRGAKPADLPVQMPTKYETVLNLKTANALGLTIPESFLLRADEMIE